MTTPVIPLGRLSSEIEGERNHGKDAYNGGGGTGLDRARFKVMVNPPTDGDSWLTKFEWRLEHGDPGSILSAMGHLDPATDPEALRALIQALFSKDQGVREGAALILGDSGNLHATKGSFWEDVITTLEMAASKAFDEEESRNILRASWSIARRLREPYPDESETWERKMEWSLSEGLESYSVRCMTEYCPTDDQALIRLMVKCLHRTGTPVLKQAVKGLAASAEKYAVKSFLWEHVLEELKAIYKNPYDTDEDRLSRAHAIEVIEKKLQGS